MGSLHRAGREPTSAALDEYLAGTADWSTAEHNALAQALNECLWDLGHPSLAPYRELQDDRNSVTPQIQKGSDAPTGPEPS